MIYFDNAATGFPKDKSVVSEVSKAIKICGNPGRSEHKYSILASEVLYSAREKLANLYSTLPEKVVLCPSATYALNMAIKGLHKNKTKILISDLEHNSVIRPSIAVGEIEVFEVDLDDDSKTIENFKNKLSKDISLVVVTHASNVCGRILPIEKIASICKFNNTPIILDASQTAGYICLNLEKISVDVVCLSGHKGLYGPMGTGALIINPKTKIFFKTIIEGGSGVMSSDESMPDYLPERLEAGTPAVHDFAGLISAVEKCDFNRTKYNELYIYLVEELSKYESIKLYGISKNNIEKYMPVILFNSINIASHDFSSYLSTKGVFVRSGFHCAPMAHKKLETGEYGAVRLSLGKNNTLKECEKFLQILKKTK